MQLIYGGGARGGKSFLGALWVLMMCKKYPGSQWFVARHELKALKRTTLRTLFQALKTLEMKDGIDYAMNNQDMVMTIINYGTDVEGRSCKAQPSAIFFGEMAELPSDPEYDRLGSYDLTGVWLDEAQEISKNAKDTLQARFTLLQGDGWSTWPKSLYTCNPGKGWIYSEFWKPLIKESKQERGKAFVTALYTDNPYIDHKKYADAVLSTGNKVKIERLLYGNFEYDDTPGRMVDYDAMCEMFGRKLEGGKKYITCDPAGLGEDLAVIALWEGMMLKNLWTYPRCKVTGEPSELPSLEYEVREIMNQELIPLDRIAVDAVGIGQGLVDSLGCRSYVGNRVAVQTAEAKKNAELRANFKDLNSQCGFLLADAINKKRIGCYKNQHEEAIKEELDFLIQIKVDEDGKFTIMPKEEIKQKIGRSPNFRDVMMMRFMFELDEMDEEEGDSFEDYEREALRYISSGQKKYLI